jgi:hypothetical protein
MDRRHLFCSFQRTLRIGAAGSPPRHRYHKEDDLGCRSDPLGSGLRRQFVLVLIVTEGKAKRLQP